MDVEHPKDPVAGERFAVNVHNFKGIVRLRVTLEGRILTERDCPDPPCHDEVWIPPDAVGKTLLVSVVGAEKEYVRKFRIEEREVAGA